MLVLAKIDPVTAEDKQVCQSHYVSTPVGGRHCYLFTRCRSNIIKRILKESVSGYLSSWGESIGRMGMYKVQETVGE